MVTQSSCIKISFVVGCLLFSLDGVIYLVECGKEPTVICYSHALLYTLGSILFTLGSILWLKVG